MSFRSFFGSINRDWSYESSRFIDRYYEIVLARVSLLEDVPPEIVSQAKARIAAGVPRRIEWQHLFELEQQLILHVPENSLALLRAQLLKRLESLERTTDKRTEQLWVLIDAELDGKPTPAVPERQDIISLLTQYYQSYCIVLDKEQRRNAVIYYLATFIVVTFLSGIAAVVLNYSGLQASFKPYFPVLGLVIWAGVLGGAVSVVLRLSNMETRDQDQTLIVEFDKAIKASFIAPLTGCVFATVLYVVFCAHLVDGSIFPNMSTPAVSQDATTENALYIAAESPGTVDVQGDQARDQQKRTGIQITRMNPRTSKDFSLILVWSFIAGFFERFVPDMLSAIAKRNKSGDGKSDKK